MKDKIAIAGLMFVVGATLGQSLGLLPALAANPPLSVSTFDMVPFRGRIEKNGQPYSAPVKLLFRLYDTEGAPDPFYQETILDVQPAEGNFAVVLGVDGRTFPGNTPLKLGVALRTHPVVYVGIVVDNDPELSGRQRLGSAPFAVAPYLPPGTVIAFAGANVPEGWLPCDGSEVSRTTYPQLFTALGVSYGAPTSGSVFKLPDYRGRFLRGVDNGAGRDPDRLTRTAMSAGGATGDQVGSVQDRATALPLGPAFATSLVEPTPSPSPAAGQHSHTFDDFYFSEASNLGCDGGDSPLNRLGSPAVDHDNSLCRTPNKTHPDGAHSHTIDLGGDAETRPVNANVAWIIKW